MNAKMTVSLPVSEIKKAIISHIRKQFSDAVIVASDADITFTIVSGESSRTLESATIVVEAKPKSISYMDR